MNLALLLARAAGVWRDRPALSVGGRVYASYGELAARAAVLAGGFTARFGLKPGDNVALVMSNGPEYYEALFGLWHAGIAAVPVNAKLHPREIAWILDNSEAKVCLTSPDLAESIAPLRDELAALKAVVVTGSIDWRRLGNAEPAALNDRISADALAWLFYTSGTTGRPKGAMLTHRNLMLSTMNYFADVDSIVPTDCMIHCAPISHGSGIYGLPHLARGANQVIPESGGFDPAEALALIARWPGCSFFFAPTMVKRLISAPALKNADTRNLKTIVYGGGPMYVEDLLAAMRRLGPKLAQIYGQGEAPMTITGMDKAMHVEALGPDPARPRFPGRLGSAGIARTDVEVAVVDAEDRPLPPGELGEVVCRGPVVMAGYWRNPKATADSLRGGWLHTGDVGVFDADGFLTLKDRSKDLIISGGSNIYPREIEEVLLRHPGVAEASVIGRPHADWGEEVVAFVVARPGQPVSAEALDKLCLDHIARFKRPKHYRFVESLPKNNYGKVLKTELRAQLAAESDTVTAGA